MRVAIYARTSKAEGDDETSIPVQLADCRDKAEDEGWEVVKEFTDVGITGWKRKIRPGYEHLFEAADSSAIDAVLARDYERLLRNDKEGARWLELYEANGFHRFYFADEADIDLKRARDRKDWKERVAAAVYYSDRLSEKVRKTKARQAAEGVYTGGEREPFGYKRRGKTLEVDPKEAAVIHEAVKRLRRGDSPYRIVVDWNGAGITTSRGNRWRPVNFKRLMLSEHLTGRRGYPRILSDAEAVVVRAAFDNAPVASRGRPSGRTYSLSGLVFCSECGQPMRGASGRYRCSAAASGCGKASIQATPLERHIVTVCYQQPNAPDKAAATQKVSKVDGTEALAELRTVEADVEETRQLAASGGLRPADAAAILKGLGERRNALVDRIALSTAPPEPEEFKLLGWVRTGPRDKNKNQLNRILGEFIDRWEARGLTPSETLQIRQVVDAYIERVVISPRVNPGKTFDRDRVDVEWQPWVAKSRAQLKKAGVY